MRVALCLLEQLCFIFSISPQNATCNTLETSVPLLLCLASFVWVPEYMTRIDGVEEKSEVKGEDHPRKPYSEWATQKLVSCLSPLSRGSGALEPLRAAAEKALRGLHFCRDGLRLRPSFPPEAHRDDPVGRTHRSGV